MESRFSHTYSCSTHKSCDIEQNAVGSMVVFYNNMDQRRRENIRRHLTILNEKTEFLPIFKEWRFCN